MFVLLVSDDHETLEDIGLAIKICMPDWIVETVNSGNKCLKKVQSKCPDILILNNDLHDYQNTNLIQKIRLEYDIPMVFLSDKKDDLEAVQALQFGVDKYLTKPIRQFEFIAHIRSLIRQRKVR